MKPDYAAWISQNVPTRTEAYGQCSAVTVAMSAAFPELRRVRGHYICPIWGKRSHWWLVASDGEVVDPTRSQFPSGGLGEYVEWDETDQEPAGRCMNCGELYCDSAPGELFCSGQCRQDYLASMILS